MNDDDELLALMRNLTAAPGVSGQEQAVRQVMRAAMEPLGDIQTDNLGGIACRKVGESDGPRVMLAGHMDEVGFMVTRITESGFLKFQTLGGWLNQVLLSHRVEVQTRLGPIVGVIGAKPPHLMPPDERKKLIDVADMSIDIGAASRSEALEWGVRPGDAIVPVSPFTPMRNPDLLLTRAWDNRIGCALAVEVLRRLQRMAHPNTVYAVGTVQEEIGLRGAETMTALVNPDIGFAIEACPAGDMPDVPADEATSALGKGPVVSLYDHSMMPHTGLRNLVMGVAEAEDIPIQFRTSRGGTDAGKIHLHGRGVPSLVVSVPTRYIHSHNSILHRTDVESTARLLVAVVQRLDEAAVRGIKV